MIKNIIFDLSEVIISGYRGIEEVVLESQYGTIENQELLENEADLDSMRENEVFLDLLRGKLTEEEYLNHVLKNKNWNVSIEQLKTVIRSNLNKLIPGTMEIVKQLKAKGNYQLILLSDHAREWMEYIEENNKDLEMFDKKIFSYDIGAVKSDEQTFKTVLEQAGIVADETLFIDDYEKNVKNAEAVGIHGIVFENAEQLRKTLSSEYNLLQVENEYSGEDR